MEKVLVDTLVALGLAQKEIKFFLASYRLGPATVNEIAREARLQRSTAYLLLQDLLEKKFLEESYHQYKKKIYAVEPSVLLRMLSNKQRSLGRQEIELENKLPELQTLYQQSEIRPKVRVFEGVQGLVAVQLDILSAQTEILLWTNQEAERVIFTPAHHEKFITERKRRNIFIKVLAVKNEKGKMLQQEDKQDLRETRFLPEGVTFSSETYIYDNKVAILDFKKDIIGVIIQSESIAATQKALFEMTWQQLS